MLNSRSDARPKGIANSSGLLGCYIMDHFGGAGARGVVPGFEDRYSFGRRPTGIYMPSFRHEKADDVDFVRGYGYQGGGSTRPRTSHTGNKVGIGAAVKEKVGRASLHPVKTDDWGMPLLHIDAYGRDNEKKMLVQAAKDAEDILIAGGCINVKSSHVDPENHIELGSRTHEMGGACMGSDPKKSVLNKWCQAHDVPNLFVTDGASMSSCSTQNPSLTYMALTARAADHAAKLLKEGVL